MRQKNTGEIVFTLRTLENISQKELARGLCSISALSRIEMSERMPDKLLLDALLQRLGKSPDKLESIITLRDYKLCVCREQIQECIKRGSFNEAKRLLSEYKKEKEAEEKVHKLYIFTVEAILSELADNDIEQSKKFIEEGIALTMPEGEVYALEHFLLSKAEIQLILMKINNYDSSNNKKLWETLDKLNDYVKRKYTDEEELVKIYPKIIRAEAEILFSKGHFERAVEICEAALDLLGKNGVLTGFYGMLGTMIRCLEQTNMSEKLKKMEKWRDILNEIYAEYEINADGDYFSELIAESKQGEILLVNELIQRGRKVRGLTQEKLCEDICTPENLSAIESGKRAPSLRNYDKFMRKLGMDKDYFNSFISTQDFEYYELRRECKRCISLRKYEEAELVNQKMKQLIDMNIPINRQYITTNEICFLHRKGEITTEEALKRAIENLELTFDYKNGDFSINAIFTQEEVKILNFIGVLYIEIKQEEKAISIFKKVLDSYNSSRVSTRNHYISYSLIISNLCMVLEELNRIEESKTVTEHGIKEVLCCGRGNLLSTFLTNKFCCYEKEGNVEGCKKYLQQAFYISDMMKNDYVKSITKSYFSEKFGEID